jgi:uncharacterized protein YprB with RNaseH-like and TPR domain
VTTESPSKPALTREQLRRMIRRIERQRPPVLPVIDRVPTLTDLLPDFVTRETEGGACAYREVRYALTEYVGDRTLEHLPNVQGATLELLAPDEGLGMVAAGEVLYLDIETTGLGGAGAMAFLVGTGRLEGDDFVLRQYLALSPADEGALLDALLDDSRLGERPVLATYNGRRFDAPVLDERATMHRRRAGFDSLRQLDLLHPVRAAYGVLLDSCRLAVVEADVLGLTRHDEDVPGAEVPRWYFLFLRSGDARHLLPIINHNAQDVVSLGALVARFDSAVRRTDLVPFDEIAVGRLLARRRDARAVQFLSGALEGLPSSEVRRDVLMRLALTHKRAGDRDLAEPLWEELATGGDRGGLRAHVELAVYYEHHVRDLARAAEVVERALLSVSDTVAPWDRQGAATWRSALGHRMSRIQRRLAARGSARAD